MVITLSLVHSSGDEGGFVRSGEQKETDGPGSSEDEFEREMESEVMDALKLLTSPTALQACSSKTSQGEGPKRREGQSRSYRGK